MAPDKQLSSTPETHPTSSNSTHPSTHPPIYPPPSPPPNLFAHAKPQPPDRTLYRPIAQLVDELTNYDKQIIDPETGFTMTLEQITVNLPIEITTSITDEDIVTLSGSAPTQTVETTTFPVLHRMTLNIVATDGR